MRLHEIITEDASPLLDNPAFQAWFRDSKIVDRHGNPLRVFHGTAREFDSFEVRAESQDHGIYFTPDPDYASGYATSFGASKGGGNIIPVYLSVQNPFFCLTKPTDIQLGIGKRGAFTDACIRHFKEQGYDGLVTMITDYEFEKGYRTMEQADEICIFSPHQAKSVFNRGTFDPDSAMISEQVFYKGYFKARYSPMTQDILILKNPSRLELENFRKRTGRRSVRGLLGEDLLVWDAGIASHDDIIEAFGAGGYHVYLNEDYFEMCDYFLRHPDMEAEVTEAVVTHPVLQRLYGGIRRNGHSVRGFRFVPC